MKREFLKSLELADEVIDKIMAENGKDSQISTAQKETKLQPYITKTKDATGIVVLHRSSATGNSLLITRRFSD